MKRYWKVLNCDEMRERGYETSTPEGGCTMYMEPDKILHITLEVPELIDKERMPEGYWIINEFGVGSHAAIELSQEEYALELLK